MVRNNSPKLWTTQVGDSGTVVWSTVSNMSDQDRRRFKEALARLMADRDLQNPEALARFIGVTKSTGYNLVDPDKNLPAFATLVKIADAFEVPLDVVVGRVTPGRPAGDATGDDPSVPDAESPAARAASSAVRARGARQPRPNASGRATK